MKNGNDTTPPDGRTGVGPGLGWWLGQLLLTGIAGFFLLFGVSLLVASYRLPDPFSFVMTFFAASLMILISAVMILGFVLRMRRAARREADPPADDPEP